MEVSGLDLDIIESAVDAANIEDCPSSTNRPQRESPCYLHNPCLNGGTCHGMVCKFFDFSSKRLVEIYMTQKIAS